MKREEYIEKLLHIYSLVTVLSQKNGCKVLRLRNKKMGKDLVLRSFPCPIMAYERLKNICCANLPEIYDIIELDDGQIVLEEYVDSVTVAQVMETDKYRLSDARKVLLGVCDALTILHVCPNTLRLLRHWHIGQSRTRQKFALSSFMPSAVFL